MDDRDVDELADPFACLNFMKSKDLLHDVRLRSACLEPGSFLLFFACLFFSRDDLPRAGSEGLHATPTKAHVVLAS